jgi:hypothetical protein
LNKHLETQVYCSGIWIVGVLFIVYSTEIIMTIAGTLFVTVGAFWSGRLIDEFPEGIFPEGIIEVK